MLRVMAWGDLVVALVAAVAAGVFGVVGVLLGARSARDAAEAAELRRERQAANRAARLVWDALGTVQAEVVVSLRDGGRPRAETEEELVETWKTQREALATMSWGDWYDVSIACKPRAADGRAEWVEDIEAAREVLRSHVG
jgi:hypothetical protein